MAVKTSSLTIHSRKKINDFIFTVISSFSCLVKKCSWQFYHPFLFESSKCCRRSCINAFYLCFQAGFFSAMLKILDQYFWCECIYDLCVYFFVYKYYMFYLRPKLAILLRIAVLREVKNGGGLTLTFVSSLRQAKGVLPTFTRSSILKVFSHWDGLEAPAKIFQVTSASTWKNVEISWKMHWKW